jgi:hypothetical protein
MRESYAALPTLPVVDGEASYEKLNDTLPTEWTRAMFWLCMMNGAAGHTYGANGIWQLNRRGQPHGASPHGTGNGYGVIAWDEAMLLPGSEQMGIGKRFFESLPWTRLAPMHEDVAWADAPVDVKEDTLFAPQMCGQGENLRAVYVLRPQPIIVGKLKPLSTYRVTYFDPVSGKRTPIAPITSGAKGQFRCAAPGHGHDWVLLVELTN